MRHFACGPYAQAMIDEPTDVTLDDEELPDLDRSLTELTPDELIAMKDAYAARGIRIYNSVPWEVVASLSGLAAVYSKTVVETLAKHNAEWLIDAVRTRIRRNGRTREALVGPEANAAAIIVVTDDLPDEARLALLDLDVTAPELRGKDLRWDTAVGEWRPAERQA